MTTSGKHTQGKWSVVRCNINASMTDIRDETGKLIAICHIDHAGRNKEEYEANAALIVSLPELLAERDALKKKTAFMEELLKRLDELLTSYRIAHNVDENTINRLKEELAAHNQTDETNHDEVPF